MEAVHSSETYVKFYRTTRRYIQGDSTLHSHRLENFKSINKLRTIFWELGAQ
jgi:hypothetical protein